MNRDFVEMLSALSDAEVEYLIVGAHALAAHGVVRATGDLDIWVRPSASNAKRVWAALHAFGAPLHDLSENDLSRPDLVFQMGVPPHRIDILTSITGVEFEAAWRSSISVEIDTVSVPVLGKEELIQNKRAAARPRDLADVDELTRGSQS